MKTKFYWVALLASAALIAQAQAGGYRGGGGTFAAPHFAAPAFHSAPMRNFGGGRFVAPAQRFPATGMRSPNSFRQQRFVGPGRDAFGSRRPGASEMISRHGDRFATSGSHRFSAARDHVFARRTANWHRDWDRHRDHWWRGHRFRFVNGEWSIFDLGFYPWSSYGYPYDYYPDDYYAESYSGADPNYYDEGAYISSSDQSTDSTIAAAAQEQLARRGYYRGEIDGIFGPATRRAIMRYQSDHGLRVTGRLNMDMLHALGLPRVASN